MILEVMCMYHVVLCQLTVSNEPLIPLDLCMNTPSMVGFFRFAFREFGTKLLGAIGQWIMMDVDDGYVLW